MPWLLQQLELLQIAFPRLDFGLFTPDISACPSLHSVKER